MNKIFVFLFIFFSIGASAQMQFVPLANGLNFGAVLPCIGEKKTVNSSIGVTNALQCRIDNGSSVCSYVMAEQPLDFQSFNKSGFDYIAEVHRQYALQMDKNFRTVYAKINDMGGLGKIYSFELIRSQDGMQVNVKGAWLVSNGKLLRGAINCAPNGTNFMKKENELFLNSFSIIK